jgi:uncharacterized protein YbjT (DUF2867 family)
MIMRALVLAVTAAALAFGVSACTGAGVGSGLQSGLQDGRILVAGGSGRQGVYVMRQLQAAGLPFRATTRSIAEARKRLGADAEGVEWLEVDLREPADATRAMQGITHVISVIGSRELTGPNSAEFVDYGAVRNLVDAAVAEKAGHVVLLTAIGTSDKDSYANKLFKGALEWRFKGEEHLRRSGLAYTVVRPAGLVNEPAGRKGVALYQGDDWKSHARKTISRDDLALVLIESLRNPGARNATFEIANDPTLPPDAWRAQMAALKPD